MPAVHFDVRWPDGSVETCYSPSTIIKHYLEVGRVYPLADFVVSARAGLHAASERVRDRYGSSCSLAMAQLASIEAMVGRQRVGTATVKIERFDP